ncbi:MAG TPA: SDR family NAD(P)-dependent oxidoreductase, partial [Pseudonocardiaceae bacterium]
HPLLGAVVPVAGGEGVLFAGRLSAGRHRWLGDHRVGGVVLLPGAALADVLTYVGTELHTPVVEELTISAPAVIPDSGAMNIQISVDELENGKRQVRCYTRPDGDQDWTEHATGTLAIASTRQLTAGDLAVWPPVNALPADLTGFYDRLTVGYGPAFRAVRAVWLAQDRVFAEIALPAEADQDVDGYGLHPVLIDAALHPLSLAGFFADPDQPRLAFAWSGIRLHATGARSLRVCLTPAGPDAVAISAADESGAPVLDIESLVVRPVELERLRSVASPRDSLFGVEWVGATASEPVADWAFYSDLAATDAVPPVVVLRLDSGENDRAVPEHVRSVCLHVLEIVRDWLASPRWAAARLVVAIHQKDLAQQAVAGLIRTAETENPGRFGLLEVTSSDAETVRIGLAASGEPQVAVRDGEALVARLARVPLPALAQESRLRGGTVLVTGASGGLGRLLAEHLALVHQVRDLVLITRSGVSPELVETLAGRGVSVRAIEADVADRSVMANIVASVADRLVAVIHLAGVVDDGVVSALTAGQVDAVLSPKVDGAWHLHELTKDLDLAAFVLYSSASSILGGAGQGNYAAANAFLDALAEYRHELGLPAVSLAWGLWSESAGMGGRLSKTDLERMARFGTLPLSAEQGLELFDLALASDRATLMPMRLDLAAVRTRGEVPSLLRLVAPPVLRRAASRNIADVTLAQRLRTLSETGQNEVLLELVRTNAAVVLGHAGSDAVEPDHVFKDLGFDSLTAVELRNRLTEIIGIRLPTTVVFNYPTPRVLGTFLRTELLGESAQTPAANGDSAVADEVVRVGDDPVVVVGMGCRLPGGVGCPEDLWGVVSGGVDAVSGFPLDRGWPGDLFD